MREADTSPRPEAEPVRGARAGAPPGVRSP